MQNLVLRTQTRPNSLEPVWHENLSFPFIPGDFDLLHLEVRISGHGREFIRRCGCTYTLLITQVWDQDQFTDDDLIGSVTVEYATLQQAPGM